MDAFLSEAGGLSEPVRVVEPTAAAIPVVLVSPHSGQQFPASFLESTRLDERALRRSEDCFVDLLFSDGPAAGAPLISATFARAFLDANREAFELDPSMFSGPLPTYVNRNSPRVKAGLGTIPRVVSRGQDIYARKLDFAEALERIQTFYVPFHEAVQSNITKTQESFGACILIDCHSMPSSGLGRLSEGPHLADFVLGDCYGSSCAPIVTDSVESWLLDKGYRVARNAPYAGGFTTRHYGRPDNGVHAIQIEINRKLYMDERDLSKNQEFEQVRRDMAALVGQLGCLDLGRLRAA